MNTKWFQFYTKYLQICVQKWNLIFHTLRPYPAAFCTVKHRQDGNKKLQFIDTCLGHFQFIVFQLYISFHFNSDNSGRPTNETMKGKVTSNKYQHFISIIFSFVSQGWSCSYDSLSHVVNYYDIPRSSHLQMFLKKGVLKNFAILTGKHLRQSLFFLLNCNPKGLQLYQKETPTQVFSCES